jgi:hypothetical protein
MSRIWSPKEEEILKKLHSKGYSIKKITTVLKSRNYEGIRKHGMSLGLEWHEYKINIDFEEFKKLMKSSKERTI